MGTFTGPAEWPGCIFDSVTVYLLCGHKWYRTASGAKYRHYCGATANFPKRLKMHRAGRSRAKLVTQFHKHGIKLRVAKTWSFALPQEGWEFEKQLKREANFSRHCKYCSKRAASCRARENKKKVVRRAAARKNSGGGRKN